MLSPFNISIRTFVSARTLHPKKFTSILADVPVRPRNPWQIYLRDNLKNYKNEAGKIDTKVAAVELGKKWKVMGDADKKYFVDTYHKESEAHKKALEEALQKATPKQFSEENQLRAKYKLTKLKDPKAPKQPPNSFLIYLSEFRKASNEKMGLTESTAIGSEKYRKLSPSEKQIYTDKAKKLMDEYKVKKAEYDAMANK